MRPVVFLASGKVNPDQLPFALGAHAAIFPKEIQAVNTPEDDSGVAVFFHFC
jgi:hypothetical protein